MKKLVVICEGRTEVNFVKNLLCGHKNFQNRFVVFPVTLMTGKNPAGGTAKGGWRISNGYAHGLKEIKNFVSLHRNEIVTTFFDLYGFPSDIPCFTDARTITEPIGKAKIYERQMKSDIEQFDSHVQFLPHVQPYEFEAFLFANP
jgi:hypothetical protein